MSLYRKKPVLVKAWPAAELIEQHRRGYSHLPEEIQRAWLETVWFQYENGVGSIKIGTLEGDMRAGPDDWVICGVKGELYPCKPDIFEETYERVSPPPPA